YQADLRKYQSQFCPHRATHWAEPRNGHLLTIQAGGAPRDTDYAQANGGEGGGGSEIIAGIDPSTSTGVCIMEDSKVIHTELLKIKPRGWDNGRAYAFYADSLWAIFVSFGVQAFAVESKIPMGSIASNAA